MQVFKFHRGELNMFDNQHLNLVYNQEMYMPFIQRVFSIENFERQIQDKRKNYNSSSRTILSEVLKNQYREVKDKEIVLKNINSLADENSFSVTTGHQLSLFTGPLYFILKILHVVKLSNQLNEKYLDYNFIPIFWMASEDHDFAEIQSTNVFGQTFKWESSQKGPVGRFDLTGLDEVKMELKKLFENHPTAEILELIECYDGGNLADATRKLVHELFKKFGLVIIDADDKHLKKLFAPIVAKELTEQFSNTKVTRTNVELKREGAKIQVNSREINMFYIKNGIRSRVELKEGKYFIQDIGTFSEKEILDELDQFPERFSPNVILRPLYQETILPNLAYIGGVGEISYWLQLKGVFDEVNCTYPLIGIRNSVLWIDNLTSKKIAKIDFVLEDIFKDTDLIKKEYIEQNGGFEIDILRIEEVASELGVLMDKAIVKVDAAMGNYAASEVAKLNKQIDGLRAKLIKLSKANNESAMSTIEFIKERLFPSGSLQERSRNFFSFCADGNYTKRIDQLYDCLDPLENDFIILREF